MILYFSGTGNSEYVALRLSALTGIEALDIFERIKEKDYSELESDKPWVIVAPVYAWKLPWIVEEYLQQIELRGSSEIYYVLTCGDSVAGAGRYADKLSRKIGKKYRGLAPVVMPENYIAMFPVPDREQSLEIIEGAEDTIRSLAECIRAGRDFDAKPGSTFMSSCINFFFYKFMVKDKKFTADENCNGCGKCVRECPLNNVKLEESRPVWMGKCTHCMRCICRCPQEAIEYGRASIGKWRYMCPASAEDAGQTTADRLDFAKAGQKDIPEICGIYDRVHDSEEQGKASIGWNRDIYPTRETAEEAVKAGEMYVAIESGKIVAAARINKEQVHPAYDEIDWKYSAEDDEVMVIHTLVVDPEAGRKGIGRAFVEFYEKLAADEGCSVLRLDTNEKNERARNMYRSMGYEEAGITPCVFNGISGVNLVCIEKKLQEKEN